MPSFVEKLNRPSGNHDVFALDFAATPLEVIKDTLWADHETASFRFEGNKDVQIECGNRLKIEGGANSAADGVTFDNAVGVHLINGRDGVSNVHTLNRITGIVAAAASDSMLIDVQQLLRGFGGTVALA